MLALLVMLTIAAADAAAQELPLPSTGWTLDGVAKVGLGVAAFFAYVGGSAWVIKYLLGELKASREAYLAEQKSARAEYLADAAEARTAYIGAIERRDATHSKELDEIRAYWEQRDEKLREKLHTMSNAVTNAVSAIEILQERSSRG